MMSGVNDPDSAGAPISLRPRPVISLRAWIAMVGGSALLFVVAMIAGDPEDRGPMLERAIYRRLDGAREVDEWCPQALPPPPARHHTGGPYDDLLDDLAELERPRPPPDSFKVNYLDVPPHPWWQRLTRTQPFTGTASITASRGYTTCELRVRFEARIEWKDVWHTTHDQFGHASGMASSKRPYYEIAGLHNVTGEPTR